MSLSRTRSRSMGAQRRSISADSLGRQQNGQGVSDSVSASGNQSVPMGPPAPRQNVGRSATGNVIFGSNAGAGTVLPEIGSSEATRREVVKLETLMKEMSIKLIGAAKFPPWKKSVINIGKWRGWPADLLTGDPTAWDGSMNPPREEAYLVLNFTIDESLRYLVENMGLVKLAGVTTQRQKW